MTWHGRVLSVVQCAGAAASGATAARPQAGAQLVIRMAGGASHRVHFCSKCWTCYLPERCLMVYLQTSGIVHQLMWLISTDCPGPQRCLMLRLADAMRSAEGRPAQVDQLLRNSWIVMCLSRRCYEPVHGRVLEP